MERYLLLVMKKVLAAHFAVIAAVIILVVVLQKLQATQLVVLAYAIAKYPLSFPGLPILLTYPQACFEKTDTEV